MVGQSVVSSASLLVSMEFWETGILFFLGLRLKCLSLEDLHYIINDKAYCQLFDGFTCYKFKSRKVRIILSSLFLILQIRLPYAIGDVKLSTRPGLKAQGNRETSFKAMLVYLQPNVRTLSIHVLIYYSNIPFTIASCKIVVFSSFC